MNRNMQAVFWDYDNTILATAEAHWQKHKSVLAKHGIVLTDGFKNRIYTNNGSQNWAWISEELGLRLTENEYLKEIDKEFQEVADTLEFRPGVEEAIKFLNQQKIPQAIVTNARKSSAKPILIKKNIYPLMQFVLFKEDYTGRKPDPAPYLRGISCMESILGKPLNPRFCLAIEDDPNGVESAHKAGMTVIHRKLNECDADCLHADFKCFHSNEFVLLIKQLVRAVN